MIPSQLVLSQKPGKSAAAHCSIQTGYNHISDPTHLESTQSTLTLQSGYRLWLLRRTDSKQTAVPGSQSQVVNNLLASAQMSLSWQV